MKIGYKRVSTLEQNLDRQDFQDVDKIFEEKTSGSTSNRPVLEEMIEFVREGDQIFCMVN
jgi:DNA invertase Pin-like site-specific DNA recombinase